VKVIMCDDSIGHITGRWSRSGSGIGAAARQCSLRRGAPDDPLAFGADALTVAAIGAAARAPRLAGGEGDPVQALRIELCRDGGTGRICPKLSEKRPFPGTKAAALASPQQ